MEIVQPHSRLGIVSCLTGAAAFLISVVSALIYLNAPNALLRMLLIVLLPISIHLACLVLSLTALFFPNRRRLYPVLGAGLNGLFLICTVAPWIYFLSFVKLRVL